MLALIAALSVILTPGAKTFALGDDIRITFLITNTGTAPYAYTSRSYDRSGRIPEFELIATRADGVALVDPRQAQRAHDGGGLGMPRSLAPGESFKQTIALNVWALVDAPGSYTVVGRYHFEGGGHADSPPVTIRVTPRSTEAMGRYIETLGAALKASSDSGERQQRIETLAFTRDARAVPYILAATAQDEQGFWAGDAFALYLPKTAAVRDLVVAHVRARGLGIGTVGTLVDLGVADDEMRSLIAASLEPGRRQAWPEAAAGAQLYGDDRFMPRLIEIAAMAGDPAREHAIYALAMNRTDAGVAALKRLLVDPNARIREHTAAVIRDAYHQRGAARGRPLRPEDFPDLAR